MGRPPSKNPGPGKLTLEQLEGPREGRIYPHPFRSHDLYTPITEDMIALFERIHDSYGSWNAMCRHVGMKVRLMRRMRKGESRTISLNLLDRILTRSNLGFMLIDFEWYTTEEIVEMGLWRPMRYTGNHPRDKKGRFKRIRR